MSFYEKAKDLLYKHVVVETDVKQSKDFASSYLHHRDDEEAQCGSERRNLAFTGYLKVIDPISHSVILCHLTDELRIRDNMLIFGRNICDINQSNHPKANDVSECDLARIVEQDQLAKLNNHPYYYKEPADQQPTSLELISLQKDIIAWFTKYRIPIKLIGPTQELLIADCVRIKPPYRHESDYVCPTRVVLRRIKNMVDQSRQPENLEEDT